MSKITLNNYQKKNEEEIEKYFNGQHAWLNEYFYIQDPIIIRELLDKLNTKNFSEKQNAHFLTGFFWNQSNEEYTLAENYGKTHLRLSSFKDDNTFIEIKDLSLEERINFIENFNYITENNSYLKNLFKLENKRFSQALIDITENKEILKKVKDLYCLDWINQNDMIRLMDNNLKLLRNIDLNKKLNNELKPKNIVKKNKI